MSANTIPDDVMRAARAAFDAYANGAGRDVRECIASAILAEREAQKERDAKTALGYAPLTGFTLLGLRKAIADAILNPPSAASSLAEQTGEAQFLPASPVTNSNWITWSGGECPVAGATMVVVQIRSDSREEAEEWEPERADLQDWDHNFTSWDIIAYRVVPSLTHEEAQ